MVLNVNAIKTTTVILKLVHVVLGAVSIGINGYYMSSAHNDGYYLSKGVVYLTNPMFFYMLTTFAFLLTSFLLLVTYLFDDTAEKIGKSHFEIIYHIFGAIFIFAAALCHISNLLKTPLESRRLFPTINALMVVVAISSSLNFLMYLANAILAFRLRSQDVNIGLNRGGVVLSPSTSVQFPAPPYGQSATYAPGSTQAGLNKAGFAVKN